MHVCLVNTTFHLGYIATSKYTKMFKNGSFENGIVITMAQYAYLFSLVTLETIPYSMLLMMMTKDKTLKTQPVYIIYMSYLVRIKNENENVKV